MNRVSICEALRDILRPDRVQTGREVELREDAPTSTCRPVSFKHHDVCWVLRLSFNDHLPFLAELPKEQSVRSLPDYLIFAESPDEAPNASIRVVIGEMKSSEKGALSARRQVQLGKLLAEHLVCIARLHLGLKEEKGAPRPWCVGLIMSPDIPSNLVPKGGTKPSKAAALLRGFDQICGMSVYHARDGGEIHLNHLF